MKRWIFATAVAFGALAHAAPETQDVNGLWNDAAGPAFSNAYLILAQEGREVRMAHYLEFNGTPMVEHGQGFIDDGNVVLQVRVSKPIPGWATAGTHTLKLSDDGVSLKGEYLDSRGNKGPLEFRRARNSPASSK
ncbi:MAG: hypothetical protein K0S28_1266 [Paucimonas sp.]|jgi:hypothetical protein|nr:hypothetical protein [Paucimonas sp.]